MQLTSAIARQIVERSMKIIQFPINVMDINGHIIGSADPARINERHDGAVLCLSENRIVEIDQGTADKLHGVKPGVNLPIVFKQQPIGVVGITGEPELVRHYGELVKMTAELIVEQADLMAKIQWGKRHREELVMQLIESPAINERQLALIAERLGLQLEQPRIAAVIQLTPLPGNLLTLEDVQHLIQLLESPERGNLVGVASVSQGEIVVLKPVLLKESGWSVEHERKRIDQLMRRVNKHGRYTIRIALGDYFPTLQGLEKSYQSARALLKAVSSQHKVLFFEDHILPVLISGLKDEPWRYEHLHKLLVALKRKDSRGQLRKTLEAYFSCDCDLSHTCEKLHIHRNTLRYRLDKIEQLTSVNLSNLSEKTLLYLALLLHPDDE